MHGASSHGYDFADPERDLEKPLVDPHSVAYSAGQHSIAHHIHALKHNWPTLLQRFLSVFKPQIFSRAIGGERKLRSTAYLDGLRGWAALHVYVTHHIAGVHMWLPIERAYGYDTHRLFITLPIVRVLFTGSHIAVYVFFVISGYVLSRSTILQIHGGSGDIAKSLASAVCRRWVRLWIPVMATTFVAMSVGYVLNERELDQEPLYLWECWRWLKQMDALAFPWTGIALMDYNLHTWTIPVEYRGSIVVFLSLLATHKMSKKARLMWLTFVALYFHYHGQAFAFTFLMGTVLAEIDILAVDGTEWPDWPWLVNLQQNKIVLLSLLLLFAFHLAGQPMISMGAVTPQEYLGSPGFYYLGLMIPAIYFGHPNDFWYGWGAVFIVLAVTNIPFLKRLFELRFTQYLGKISFGFYLVHGPILNTLGNRLYHAVGAARSEVGHMATWNDVLPLPEFGPLGFESNFVIVHIILLPFTFWCAEVTTKLFDEPSVRFARWCYQKTLA